MKAIKRRSYNVAGWISRIILALCAIGVIFPLVWLLYTSVKDGQEFSVDLWAFPKRIKFENYKLAFEKVVLKDYVSGKEVSVFNMLLNTSLVTIVGVVLVTFMAAVASFILEKYKFRGIGFFRTFFFAAIMIPSILLVVPLYTQLREINKDLFINNRFILALIYAVQALPMQIFLLSKFIRTIDNGLIEAARIDGANEFVVFFKMIVPCITPILAFVALVTGMAFWNEYTVAMIFMKDYTKMTISVGLTQLTAAYERVDLTPIFAGYILALLPIFVLYAIFQKPIQNGMDMDSGIKG